MLDWRHSLEQKWAALRFGEVKVETKGGQHVFDVQVHLHDLDANAISVELYADGVDGGSPVRQEMKRVRQLPGAPGGYGYRRLRVRGPPASGLYGADDTASRWRRDPVGIRANPVATMSGCAGSLIKRKMGEGKMPKTTNNAIKCPNGGHTRCKGGNLSRMGAPCRKSLRDRDLQ